MTDSKISNLPAATTLSDTDDLVIASSGTSKKITGINLRSSLAQILGQVSFIEAYVDHDVSTGSLPTIDGASTIEGCIVFLNNQADNVENGVWTVHQHTAWERPSWFANGLTFPGGQIIHCAGGNGCIQFDDVLITFDNATDAALPYTVGVDPINSDSVKSDNGFPPLGFPNVEQGPFAPIWFASTDATSILGAGTRTWYTAFGDTGFDFAQQRLVNLPEPTDSTEAATKHYAQTHAPRVVTPAITSSYVIDADATDLYVVAGQSSAVTFTPTGTPTEGQRLTIRIKDDTTPRGITWNSTFRGSSSLPLPTTTSASKTMYASFIYNNTDARWDMLSLLDNFA